MASQSRVDLQTTINTNLADNTTGAITAELLREVNTNINDSSVNKTTDTDLIGWYEFSATKNYYNGELVIYSNNLYKFNQNHSAGAWNSAHADLIGFNGATQFSASIDLTSPQVKALKSSPQTIVTCPTGKTIVVTACSIKCGAGSAAYATDKDVVLITDTATKYQYIFKNILANISTQAHWTGVPYTTNHAASDTMLISNKDLKVSTATADPITGDYGVTVYVTFRLI